MTDKPHFFEDAPVIPWTTWLWRKLWGAKGVITLLPNEKLPLEPPALHHPEFEMHRLNPAHAEEYSIFLNRYYYIPKDIQLNLSIPPDVMEKQLREGRWTGVEVRNKYKNVIIGLVFSLYAGAYNETPMGLITWLCVKPNFRKQGLTNILLRSIYALNQPTTIYWWRTDGWLKSPCPPVYTETRMVRRSKPTTCYANSIHIVEDTTAFVNNWKKANPDSVILYSTTENPLLSIYEYRHSATEYVQVAIQPTFERENRISDRTYYEIVGWVVSEGLESMSAAMYVEALLDEIHLADWYEAPVSIPHLDSKGWELAGKSSWSVLGLDPGTADSLPILALAAA